MKQIEAPKAEQVEFEILEPLSDNSWKVLDSKGKPTGKYYFKLDFRDAYEQLRKPINNIVKK